MQDTSAREKVVVVHAKSLFRVVPVDRKGAVVVNVRLVHHPVAETAQHLDNGKLAFEWKVIELISHHSISPTLVVEHQALVDHIQAVITHIAVLVNEVQHTAQIAVGEICLGPGKLGSETLVVGLELSYDAGRLVVEGNAQGLIGDWVHCPCGVSLFIFGS